MKNTVFVNYLKGISACIICFVHITSAFFNANFWWARFVNTPVLPTADYPSFFVNIRLFDYASQMGYAAAFAVMMFFLLSSFGIFFSLEKRGLLEFWERRCIKLVPIFLIVLLFDICLVYINGFIYNQNAVQTPKDWLLQAFMSVQSTIFKESDVLLVTWFLGILISYYVLISFIYYSYKKIYKDKIISEKFLLVCDVIVIALLFLNSYQNVSFLNKEGIEKFLTFSLFMLNGNIFYMYSKNIIPPLKTLYLIILQIVITSITYRGFGARYNPPADFFLISVIVILVFWLCYMYSKDMQENRILLFLGKISYVLYLIHGFLGFSVFSYLVIKINMPVNMACIVSFIIAVCAAAICEKYIEAPLNKFLNKMMLGEKNANSK